jgi:hypothetical protein
VEKPVRRRRAVEVAPRDTPEPATSKSPDQEPQADGGAVKPAATPAATPAAPSTGDAGATGTR